MVELIVANEMVDLVSGLMAIHQTGMALTQEKMISHSAYLGFCHRYCTIAQG